MASILVAEPDEFFAKFYSLKLKQAGHEVEWVTDGQDTFKKLQEKPYQVIIMNLMLPRKNGFLILQERASTVNANTPMIVVTELAQEKDQAEAKNLGITEYFVKQHTDVKKIVSTINRITNHNVTPPTQPTETTEESKQKFQSEINENKNT